MNPTMTETIQDSVNRLGIERDALLDRFLLETTRQLMLSGWRPHEIIWSLSYALEELGPEWVPIARQLEEKVVPEAIRVEEKAAAA